MLPQSFLNRMKHQLGAEYGAFLESFQRPRAVALRLNPLKGEAPALPFVTGRVPWEPMGYYYDPKERPGLHPYHEAGVYYLQEASAMAPVALLDPQPGERVLDLCAAPGGKSTQIAGRLLGKGLLVCNEIHPARARVLAQNIERLGIANALVTNEKPEGLAQKFPGFFDRVLVDAPCSGEGMFRKEEAAVTDWSPETVQMCARRQGEILEEAAKMLRPGGRMVYSTCTFAPQEDEEVIAAFLERYPEFRPEEVPAPWFDIGENASYRMWPHKLLGEGHFAAVLRKVEGEEPEIPLERGARLPKAWESFAKDTGIKAPEGTAVTFGTRLFLLPEGAPELKGLRVLRPGLELGELKKDRLEPAHALALWLGDCGNTVSYSWDSQQIRRYLHGESLSESVRGWCLVRVDGYSIGWGKGDGGQLKNHYPKGLRR